MVIGDLCDNDEKPNANAKKVVMVVKQNAKQKEKEMRKSMDVGIQYVAFVYLLKRFIFKVVCFAFTFLVL